MGLRPASVGLYLAVGAAMLAAGARVAAQLPATTVEPAALLREAIALACTAQSQAEVHALRLQLPVTRWRRQALRLSRLGWRGRFEVPGGVLTLERIVHRGALQRISAQFDAVDGSAARGRPLLLAITGLGCEVATALRLHYDAAGRPDWLEPLDARLAPTGRREELNPPVPARRDPGGVTVAHIDTGVNYLLPAINRRLARDPAGALIGYDFWDLDDRPFDADPAASPFFPSRHGTQTASLLIAEAPFVRLLPYRYPRPEMSRMAALIEHAAANGVRLVNLSLVGDRRHDWQAFADAAAAHPEILFVVAAGNAGRDLDRRPAWPAAFPLANLITVTAADARGRLAPDANWGARTVDLMVPAEALPVTGFLGRARVVSGSSYAAARTTALAACLLALHPDWQAAELKAALAALARPPAEPGRVAVGLIPALPLAEHGACGVPRPASGV